MILCCVAADGGGMEAQVDERRVVGRVARALQRRPTVGRAQSRGVSYRGAARCSVHWSIGLQRLTSPGWVALSNRLGARGAAAACGRGRGERAARGTDRGGAGGWGGGKQGRAERVGGCVCVRGEGSCVQGLRVAGGRTRRRRGSRAAIRPSLRRATSRTACRSRCTMPGQSAQTHCASVAARHAPVVGRRE